MLNKVRSTDAQRAGSSNRRCQKQTSTDVQGGNVKPEATYQFILSTGEPKVASGESRKALRSHVMRNVFYQRRSAREDASHHTSTDTVTSQQSLKGRFRLREVKRADEIDVMKSARAELVHRERTPARDDDSGGNECLSEHQIPTTQASLDIQLPSSRIAIDSSFEQRTARHLDPFDTLPLPSSPRLETFLYHWMTVFNLNSIVMHTIPGWWIHFAFSDAAVLHSVLCNIAMHCGVHYKLCLTKDIYHHKGEAIKLINRKLRDPDQHASLGLIGAISSLTTYENLWGSYDLAATHLISLKRMVTSGHDLLLPAYDPLLRGVIWAAYHHAVAQRSLPHFRFSPLPSDAVFPNQVLDEATSTVSNELLTLRLYSVSLSEVFCSLQLLATACDTRWVSAVDRTLVSNTLHDLEYQLTCIAHDLSLNSAAVLGNFNSAENVIEALTAAAHAFLYAGLRKVPLVAKIFDIFLGRIIQALSYKVDVVSEWREQGLLQALLWVLAVGVVVAQERLECSWFLERIATTVLELDVRTDEQMQQTLKGFAWTSQLFASAWDMTLLAVETSRELYREELTT